MDKVKAYWVLYKQWGSEIEHERVVEVTVDPASRARLPDLLRSAVMPNRHGDQKDGLVGQRTIDCRLLNWIEL